MLRELSNEEQMLISGGQTSDELVIRDLLIDSGNIISSDGNSARTSDGTYFYDRDGNGWYDHAERPVSGWESDIYNPQTKQWERYEDIEAKEGLPKVEE